MRGRREAIYALEALRGFMPGCEDAKLRNFGMTLGIRDTRKIDALYNLTGTDVREQARFDDAIGIFPEFIDGYGVLILPTTGRYWHVPYRALVPKGVGNLLVAGRCIGGDKISHASARNMMCCAVSGQGAGVAAAVSLQARRSARSTEHRRGPARSLRGRARASGEPTHSGTLAAALVGAGTGGRRRVQQLLRGRCDRHRSPTCCIDSAGFTQSQLGMLNAVISIPNVALALSADC